MVWPNCADILNELLTGVHKAPLRPMIVPFVITPPELAMRLST